MSAPLYINNSDTASQQEKISALISVVNAMSTILYKGGVKDLPEMLTDRDIIVSKSAPTSETAGVLNQFYIHDTGTNNNLYFCSKVDETGCTWTRVNAGGGGSSGGDADTLEGHPAIYFAQMVDATLQGTPTTPTALKGTSTEQIANTEYVQNELDDYVSKGLAGSTLAPINNPHLTGTPTAPTPAANNNSQQLATTAFVQTNLQLYAKKASPAFEGAPTAPTAPIGTNTQQIATTAFANAAAQAAVANVRSGYIQCRGTTQWDPGYTVQTFNVTEWMSNNFFLYNANDPFQFVVPQKCYIKVSLSADICMHGYITINQNGVEKIKSLMQPQSASTYVNTCTAEVILNCRANDVINIGYSGYPWGESPELCINLIAERLNW